MRGELNADEFRVYIPFSPICQAQRQPAQYIVRIYGSSLEEDASESDLIDFFVLLFCELCPHCPVNELNKLPFFGWRNAGSVSIYLAALLMKPWTRRNGQLTKLKLKRAKIFERYLNNYDNPY
ncbi:MAG: hypothetical protein WAW61_10520 [Methylococcaceae bacterium]